MWELNPRELSGKQACILAFIVSNKVCIVTIIASDISDGYYPYQYQSFDTSIHKSIHKIMVDTYGIMINIYVKIS